MNESAILNRNISVANGDDWENALWPMHQLKIGGPQTSLCSKDLSLSLCTL